MKILYISFQIEGVSAPITDGSLRGRDIRFSVNQVPYSGRIGGDAMQGVAEGRVKRDWRAARVSE